MKTIPIIFLFFLISIATMSQSTFKREWKQVDSLENLGQTQSALAIVSKIYEQSKVEPSGGEFVKAAIYRMKLESDFQENYYETAIARTNDELLTASEPVKQLLHSILGELYWNYYQNNRWQILNRSITAGSGSADISTWDARKLVEASVEHYLLSLENYQVLTKTPVDQYDEILIKQKGSEIFRPTLFDFLAYRAIDFLSSSDAGIAKAALSFVTDKAEYFSPAQDFIALKIQTSDNLSFDYHVLKIYQQIAGLHISDKKPEAFIHAELERLRFVHSKSTIAEKDSLYFNALFKLESQFKNHPSSTEVSYAMADLIANNEPPIRPYNGDLKNISGQTKPDLKEALRICEDAINRFPDSFGAQNCKVLAESIKTPEMNITTEFGVPPAKPSLALVRFKNTDKIYLRLLKVDPLKVRKMNELQSDEQLAFYLSQKPVSNWVQDLPPSTDYQNHTTEIKIPASKPGSYVILASTDPTFPAKSGIVTANHFQVSGLSFITQSSDKGSNQVCVVNRTSGEAVAGAVVQMYYHQYNPKSRKYEDVSGNEFVTPKSGCITIPAQENEKRNNQYYLVIKTKGDCFISESYFNQYRYYETPENVVIQTHFFTDRSIYRPGQTISFKGIVTERKGENTSLKKKFATEVVFYDVNGQEISGIKLVTNDFGSFSGSFTAPSSVLTGQMSLRNESGYQAIQVEEYKRPKFEVTFNPVRGIYKLSESVNVTGKAEAYAGSQVQDAKVVYRVTREAQYPYWWGWRMMPHGHTAEITQGETVTDKLGGFSIDFQAIPDLTTDRKTDPVFVFTIYADVTDLNGETHSSQTTVSVGYKALLVGTNLPEEVNLNEPLTFGLTTTNLNGEKTPAAGKLTITQLKQPVKVIFKRKWEKPDMPLISRAKFEKDFPLELYSNDDEMDTWHREAVVSEVKFNTSSDSVFSIANNIKTGSYILQIETKDAFGETVLFNKYFSIFDPGAKKCTSTQPLFARLLTPTVEPGGLAEVLIGSVLKKAVVKYEITGKEGIIKSETLVLEGEQTKLQVPITEEYRGNLGINIVMVANNRFFASNHTISVPYSNKKLDIRFATFRDKLLPGQDEEWQITISGPKGEKVAAEMLAGMYDASLDAFMPHNWWFDIYSAYYSGQSWTDNGCFDTRSGSRFYYPEPLFTLSDRQFDQLNWFGFNRGYGGGWYRTKGVGNMAMSAVMEDKAMPAPAIAGKAKEEFQAVAEKSAVVVTKENEQKPAEQAPSPVRQNFNETAFFFPQLATNEKGEIVIKFKTPDALTRWKVMTLAHTPDLKTGSLTQTLVTQKDLMVFTNAPRFVREGDVISFTAKITNLSSADLSGIAELHLFDAENMQPADNLLEGNKVKLPFVVKAGENTMVSWPLKIDASHQMLTYRVSASAGSYTDAEESVIPVLSNRMMVTESLPLPIRGGQSKKFEFARLLASGKTGSTMSNYRLTLEYTSNPAWYAVQALPYLAEYPYECAEQLFSRYYANSLAAFIANSDPAIKRIFDSWKTIAPDALKSNLEKNEELKSALLQESPWVREATSENERKHRIALLFDFNRMTEEKQSALKKLKSMQSPNGGWPWFEGMPESRYITQHIVTGLGHLVNLGVDAGFDGATDEMFSNAIQYLDNEMKTGYDKLKKEDKDYLKNNHLGYEDIQYLYARSYFLDRVKLPSECSEMMAYYKDQATRYWKVNNNFMRAMIALSLHRSGDKTTPVLILRSITETALHNEETGMYWRNEQRSWYWHQAPVETQAMLIEAFDEINHDVKSVDEMNLWLLKQKQTQDWKTTKATTEAIYALLLRGTTLLSDSRPVEIKLGAQKIVPQTSAEPGTGYIKTTWNAASIKPEMGKVEIANPNKGAAWGALYLQYFEQLDKITPAQTPLQLSKKLYLEKNTAEGPVIEEIKQNTTIKTGDRIVVRIELRADRDMEYLHLKDMRASAFEPLQTLSGYRYQDGLGYYQSIKDASANFFIYYLPKGTYIFEYKLFATQKGDFSNGITNIQCMYAPEFSAHSEGIRVKVE